MFITGLKIAGASPMVASLPMPAASPEAMAPFCMPTSKATLRAEFLSSPQPRLSPYPNR